MVTHTTIVNTTETSLHKIIVDTSESAKNTLICGEVCYSKAYDPSRVMMLLIQPLRVEKTNLFYNTKCYKIVDAQPLQL